MRKDRLYWYTFISISVIFIILAAVSVRYFVRVSTDQLIASQIESSKREAKEIGSLIGSQLASGIPKETVIENIQKSIQDTDQEAGFVSMFDWSGRQICHPDRMKVGQQVGDNQSVVTTMNDDIDSEDFYQLLATKQELGGLREFEDSSIASEIIYLYPISGSDWILAAHSNMAKVAGQLRELRNSFYIIFSIMGFAMVLCSFIAVRYIGSIYEKKLELRTEHLEGEVLNLAKLNSDLDSYREKVSESTEQVQDASTADLSKKRILTYMRDELLPVSTKDIAHIYTEAGITYVKSFDGKRSISNASLDELYSGLDQAYFYRANRQFIIAIAAIEKIIRYGNNQLKILVNPDSEIDIIISKNKAAEFKQWLSQ